MRLRAAGVLRGTRSVGAKVRALDQIRFRILRPPRRVTTAATAREHNIQESARRNRTSQKSCNKVRPGRPCLQTVAAVARGLARRSLRRAQPEPPAAGLHPTARSAGSRFRSSSPALPKPLHREFRLANRSPTRRRRPRRRLFPRTHQQSPSSARRGHRLGGRCSLAWQGCDLPRMSTPITSVINPRALMAGR